MAKVLSDRAEIDVASIPELARLVDEIRAAKQPMPLVRNGEVLATIEPVDIDSSRGGNQSKMIVEREALRRSAGGWRGLVDTEEFREANRESRRLSSRPPVSL